MKREYSLFIKDIFQAIDKIESLPDTKVLKNEAIEAIIKSLGITKAAFFIRENISQKTDYLEIKKKLFGKKTAAEFCKEISKWKMKGKR